MKAHIHGGVLQGSIIFAYVILFGLAWKLISQKFADTDAGKAMHYLWA